jgi:hypothetical protein
VCDDGDAASNSGSGGTVSRTADIHPSFDRNCDKAISTALDVKSILEFMQADYLCHSSL